MYRHYKDLTDEQVSEFLKDAIEKVKSKPEDFERFRALFKKNVPMMLRSYVAGYLIKRAGGAVQRFSSFKDGEKEIREPREPRAPREPREPRERDFGKKRFERSENSFGEDSRPRSSENQEFQKKEKFHHVEISPDAAATIFVGVGKNKRVYPKDIVGLFVNVAGIEKERIGDIKVYASYSFVQLFKEDADKAISALNGYDYRGKVLSVSYSRQRGVEESQEVPTESTDFSPAPESEASAAAEPNFGAAAESVPAPAAEEQQRSFSEMSDEEILAMRAPRSSSTEDVQ